MSLFPERQLKTPEGVVEVPDVPAIPRHIENKTGIQVTRVQPGVQVTTDSSGQPVVKTDPKNKVKIEIPREEEILKALSKGSLSDSITWWAMAWWRAIKKALHFGWEIIRREKK